MRARLDRTAPPTPGTVQERTAPTHGGQPAAAVSPARSSGTGGPCGMVPVARLADGLRLYFEAERAGGANDRRQWHTAAGAAAPSRITFVPFAD